MPALSSTAQIKHPNSDTLYNGVIVFKSCLLIGVENGLIIGAWQHCGNYAMNLKPLNLPLRFESGTHQLSFVAGDSDLILCDVASLCREKCFEYLWEVAPNQPSEAIVTISALKLKDPEIKLLRDRLRIAEAELEVLRRKLAGSTEQVIGSLMSMKSMPIAPCEKTSAPETSTRTLIENLG